MALRYQDNAREPTINWNGAELQPEKSFCCWCRWRRDQQRSNHRAFYSEYTTARDRPKAGCKYLGRILITIHILLTTGIFLAFECLQYFFHPDLFILIPAIALLLATICLLLMVATIAMEPGYLPRLKPEHQELEAAHYNRERLKPDFDLSVGVRKKIRLYGEIVEGDYCFECRHFKELRTKHCKICDQCVVRHDHHCIVLGCCVGIRNFAVFYYFQAFLSFFYLYIFTCSVYVMIADSLSSSHTVKSSVMGAPSLWLIVITVLILLSLGLGHIFLFPCIYCYLMGKDRTSRQLFFVIETGRRGGCKCTKVDKGPIMLPAGSESTRRKDTITFLFSNFHTYLCTSPPPSLVKHHHHDRRLHHYYDNEHEGTVQGSSSLKVTTTAKSMKNDHPDFLHFKENSEDTD